MKLIRYLQTVTLLKSVNEKQPNGSTVKGFVPIDSYRVQKKTLDDEVNATIYGADITKMWDISSPLKDLEDYLIPKVDNQEDNISLYFINLEGSRYKIRSVKKSGITIERVQ